MTTTTQTVSEAERDRILAYFAADELPVHEVEVAVRSPAGDVFRVTTTRPVFVRESSYHPPMDPQTCDEFYVVLGAGEPEHFEGNWYEREVRQDGAAMVGLRYFRGVVCVAESEVADALHRREKSASLARVVAEFWRDLRDAVVRFITRVSARGAQRPDAVPRRNPVPPRGR